MGNNVRSPVEETPAAEAAAEQGTTASFQSLVKRTQNSLVTRSPGGGEARRPETPQAGEQSRRVRRSPFLHLSIQKRLPMLIGTLLAGIIVTATCASYIGVKESALEVSRERLRFLSQHLANLFQQSVSTLANKTLTAASDPAIRAHLQSPSPVTRTAAVAFLQQFPPPSDLRVELWNANRSIVLALPETSSPMPADLDSEFQRASSSPAFTTEGEIRLLGDKVTVPVVAAVRDDAGRAIGYLVRWRRLVGTAEARQQLMDLIGGKAALYLGNKEGEIWTDLVSVASQPPVDVRQKEEIAHYTRDCSSVLALARPIPGTPWFVLVEFSDEAPLAQAHRFLRRMMIIGAILLALGVAGALLLSRSITRPLRSLTQSASAITSGDYSRLVGVRTQDELGDLANAFNAMSVRVQNSQRELEERVEERTAQLMGANKELEAFSYSVSHDLRAPLRHINGFSQALMEDYADRLDEVGRGYLEDLRSASQEMAQLIDDVLQLARVTRSGMHAEIVDLSQMASAIVGQLRRSDVSRTADANIEEGLSTRGDRRLLNIMLNNLLENAWKFTAKRERAEITFGKLEKDGEALYFIRDNGAGFEMAYADKLFGAFQRLHTAQEFEGTGVGLATVQRIVTRHGGRIWAEAAVNQGATFYFTLPDFKG